jgi:hypothetical protein
VLGGDSLVLGDDDLAVLGVDIELGGLALQTLGTQLEFDTLLAEMEGIGLVEHVENLLKVVTQGLEQDADRQLAAAVDTEEHEILGIELEIQPGTTIGNDPRREQQLAGGMGFAPVVFEEHARRTVQLGDDNPLGAVDDEGAVRGHQGHLSHIDLLLLHFLDLFLDAFPVQDDQTHPGAHTGRVGQAALLAFDDVEHRCAQGVADEFQAGVAAMADDREDGSERRLQPHVLARFHGCVLLEETPEGFDLGGQHVRHRQNAYALGEAFAKALFLGECVCHDGSVSLTGIRDQKSGGKFRPRAFNRGLMSDSCNAKTTTQKGRRHLVASPGWAIRPATS